MYEELEKNLIVYLLLCVDSTVYLDSTLIHYKMSVQLLLPILSKIE